MSQNGISTILLHLGTASCALESSRVGIAEVKAAEVSAKTAADLLKATRVFLENEIYQVCDEPRGSAYVDPHVHRIEMPEVRHEIVAEEAEKQPLPDLLADFCSLHPAAQDKRFGDRLASLAEGAFTGAEETAGWEEPWQNAFSEARIDTYARLVWALDHRQPRSVAFPTDEEMHAWREQFIAPLPLRPADLLDFGTWDEGEQNDLFSKRTEALADLVDPEKKLDVALDPWDAAWEADRQDAWTRLLVAEAREPKSLEIPTDEERDAWLAQFAPAPAVEQPEDPAPAEEAAALSEDSQREALFNQKLEELKEEGVKHHALKRKNWKKAEKAWRLEFAGDAVKALEKLLWRLGRHVIIWDVPEDSEIPAPAPEAQEGGAA